MRISLNYDSSTIWKLPLGPAELEDSLQLMWSDFFRCYGAPGREPASVLNLGGMARSGLSLELALVDELEMAGLNGRFLNCFGPTNVLAFPAPEAALWSEARPDGAEGPRLAMPGPNGLARFEPEDPNEPAGREAYLGWLALSPDTVRREAMLYGQDQLTHTLRLLAHGFAHLLGYEHGAQMDAASNGAAGAALAALRSY